MSKYALAFADVHNIVIRTAKPDPSVCSISCRFLRDIDDDGKSYECFLFNAHIDHLTLSRCEECIAAEYTNKSKYRETKGN